MTRIDFENAIKYNENSITEYDQIFTVNLSRCLYSSFKDKPFTPVLGKSFNIEKIVNSDLCVRVFTNNRKTIVVIQPEVNEILKAFGHNYKNKIFDDFKEAYGHKKSIEKEIRSTFKRVFTFLADRRNIINGHYFIKTNFLTEEDNNELKLLINSVNEYFDIHPTSFNDYRYDQDRITKIQKEEFVINLSYLYDFKSLRNFFKNLALNPNEFYSEEEFIKPFIERKQEIESKPDLNIFEELEIGDIETRIDSINSTIDWMNGHQLFRKEIFSLICLSLEKYIEVENIIDNFIMKVLTETLSDAEVDKDFNIKTINKK